SVAEIPEPVELVVLAVTAAGFEDAVEDALRSGAKALVGITAGLGESGEAGLAVERRVADRVREAGAVLLGPNCIGVVDTSTNLNVAFSDYDPGPVALVSQSGNLALELALIARGAGLGFSRFVSVGNQADINLTDVIACLAEHQPTRVIAVYAEDFGNGRAFARASFRAREAGKPVVLLAVGSSSAGARAAMSHTGALVSASTAIDAACAASGIIRAATPREVVELALGLLMPHPPRGRRVGLVGDGGGHVALAADLVTSYGLAATTVVDLAGRGEQDFFNYERAVRALLSSREVDSVLLTGYFGGYSSDVESLARRETDVAAAMATIEGALVVHSMYPASPTLEPLRSAGVPIFGDIRAAAHVLSVLVASSERPPGEIPDRPPTTDPPRGDGYFDARRLVEQAGIELMPATRVENATEAVAAARSLGFPVVLKALVAPHKSVGGGVRLGVGDETSLATALDEMRHRLSATSWSVERMADTNGSVELIVGVRWDHSFGPVLMVGAGGVAVEETKDIAVALAPVSESAAEALLRSLKIAPRLENVNLRAAAHAASLLSQIGAEIEVNPLLVGPAGAVALDARVVLA
ncbi:MAG TPA: acetate--CoA ligase family protein, partial [Candidatus Dormibacteraeota bacterium]|nr:acetate--CoA ligase family protein [Candidatus Dormibacteraeota bacterium]